MNAVMLDVDGTLIDSYRGVVDSYLYALSVVGGSHPEGVELSSILGPPMVESLAAAGVAQEDLGRARAAYLEAYADSGWRQYRVYPGVEDFLRFCTSHSLTLATATSKGEFFTRKVLGDAGLLDYFSVLGTAGGEHGAQRPTKADVVAYTLSELGVVKDSSDNCPILMVGDRRHDFEGAAAHGVACVAARWGYGTDVERAAAWAVADDCKDLERIVGEFFTVAGGC